MSQTYVGLYTDRECENPLPRKMVGDEYCWFIPFGYLDVGEERTFHIFVENRSRGDIHDLVVSAGPVRRVRDGEVKEDVVVELRGNEVDVLPVGGVHEVFITWRVDDDASAAKCDVRLSVEGVITEER